MTRDPVRDALDLLQPATERPSPAFADELFDRLVEQTSTSPTKTARRWERVPTLPPPVRKAFIIAAALAIGAALLIPLLPLTGSQPPLAPRPLSEIALVQERWIELVDASTGEELTAMECPRCSPTAPAWSRDGSRIAFFGQSMSNCIYGDTSCSTHALRWQGIYVYGWKLGGEPRQLTRCIETCTEQPFAWSPDGTQLAYLDPTGPSRARLVVMNADGSSSTVLAPSLRWAGSLAWSPDGSVIAYSRRNRVYAIDVRTRRTRTLRGFPGEIQALAWSPDGVHIAVDVSPWNRHQDSGLVVMNADGSDARTVAPLPAMANTSALPAWAPDGSSLVFITEQHGVSVWTVDADGSNLTRIFEHDFGLGGTGPSGLTWSPDGSMIGLTASDVGQDQLFIMNRDGTPVRQLNGDGNSAVWRPATPRP